MNEIEIGPGKRAHIAYSFDDIAIVPSRRTRDPEEVSIQWQIDAYKFDLPMLAAPMDSVVSPETAIAIGNPRRCWGQFQRYHLLRELSRRGHLRLHRLRQDQ